jgi:hypothetical protein
MKNSSCRSAAVCLDVLGHREKIKQWMLRRQTLRNLIHLITIKLKSLMKSGFRVVSVRKCSFVFVLPHDFATLATEPFVKGSMAISLDADPLFVCSAIDRQHALEQYVHKIEDGKPGIYLFRFCLVRPMAVCLIVARQVCC